MARTSLGWAFVAFLTLTPDARAQSLGIEGLEARASLAFTSALALAGGALPVGSWGLIGHLEAKYALEALSFNLSLDPAVQFGVTTSTEAGITEAYALYRSGEFDLSAGVERLPLETARLSLPYALEPVDALGRRRGLPDLRLSWNPEATRLRLAVIVADGGLVPVLSLRREFGDLELEGHALYRAGRAVFGLGGSGTLLGLVLYGEAWAITSPFEGRYALGLSGALGDGVWTLEGGYAAYLPGTPTRNLVIGQYALPQGEASSWNFTGGLFFDPDAIRGIAGLTYAYTTDEADLSLSLGVQFGPSAPAWTLSLQVRRYFG